MFAIPLLDGSETAEDACALCQAISLEPDVLISVACACWPSVGEIPEATANTLPIIVALVTSELLRRCAWQNIGFATFTVPTEYRIHESWRPSRWVGARVYGSSIARTALRVWYALECWDVCKNPGYITKMLVPGVAHPSRVRFKTPAHPTA